ncbi:MAG: tetratricopeptide repeat protein [Selenomonadaceae bacterium]|nr:tetratricopeptide repeat protein [Selenomonadaceae bacterium]
MSVKSLLAIICLAINLIALPVAQAETKTYQGVGEYRMGERDTLEIAKQSAKERAMRNALEQAGVLVQTSARMEDMELVEDVITSRTGAVLKVLEVNYEEGNYLVRAIVKVEIDPEDLNNRLQNFERKSKFSPSAKKSDDNISLSNKKSDQAFELLSKGIVDGVLPILKESLQLNETNASAYEKLGWFYREMKNYDESLQNYNKSLEINPDWIWNYAGLGRTYYEMKNYEQAIQNFSRFLMYNKNEEEIYQLRGECYQAVGRTEKARADLEMSKKVAAAKEKIQEARKLCEAGKYDEASPIASEALTLNQNNALVWETLGRIYNGKKEYDKSPFYYEKAIKLDPQLADAYIGLGRAYLDLKRYHDALKNFDKYIELNPDATAFIYQCRGECYQAVGEREKAHDDFVTARKLEQND